MKNDYHGITGFGKSQYKVLINTVLGPSIVMTVDVGISMKEIKCIDMSN
jgi:hypothetical protein